RESSSRAGSTFSRWLFQVRQIFLQLLNVEAIRGDRLAAFLLEVVRAENGVGLVAVSRPKSPGHGLQGAPGDDGEAAGVISDNGDRVSAPGARRAIASRALRRNGPSQFIAGLRLRALGQSEPDVAGIENPDRVYDVGMVRGFESDESLNLV